jgi:trans-aconitate methyltransferase
MPNQTEMSVSSKQVYDDRYAGNYMDTDEYSAWGHGDLRTRQVLETLRLVGTKPGSILDYGCGVGGWTSILSHAFPEAHIFGVDISSVAIGKAQRKFPQHQFTSFDGCDAPFGDSKFDLIFSYHVLELWTTSIRAYGISPGWCGLMATRS